MFFTIYKAYKFIVHMFNYYSFLKIIAVILYYLGGIFELIFNHFYKNFVF